MLKSSKNNDKLFKITDVVWGKVSGYVWWPGKIFQQPSKGGKYRVNFFNDLTHSYLPTSKIVDYQEGIQQYGFQKKSHTQKFILACQLANKLINEKKKQKLNEIEQCQSLRYSNSSSMIKIKQLDFSLESFNNQSVILVKNQQEFSQSQSIQKQKKITKEQVDELIRKYGLYNLEQKKPKVMGTPSKIDFLLEDGFEFRQREIKQKVSKKIQKALKIKGIKRKDIITYFLDLFVKNIGNPSLINEMFKEIFIWIKESHKQQIQTNYENWRINNRQQTEYIENF